MRGPRKASLHYTLLKGLWDGLGVQRSVCCCQVEDREKDLEREVRPSVQKNVGRHLDMCGRTMGVQ
jgi:hypothetical protein